MLAIHADELSKLRRIMSEPGADEIMTRLEQAGFTFEQVVSLVNGGFAISDIDVFKVAMHRLLLAGLSGTEIRALFNAGVLDAEKLTKMTLMEVAKVNRAIAWNVKRAFPCPLDD